jgi:hypothetical protein
MRRIPYLDTNAIVDDLKSQRIPLWYFHTRAMSTVIEKSMRAVRMVDVMCSVIQAVVHLVV